MQWPSRNGYKTSSNHNWVQWMVNVRYWGGLLAVQTACTCTRRLRNSTCNMNSALPSQGTGFIAGRNISPDEGGGEAGTNYRVPEVPGADQVARVFVFIDRSVFFDLQMDPFRPSPSLCNWQSVWREKTNKMQQLDVYISILQLIALNWVQLVGI